MLPDFRRCPRPPSGGQRNEVWVLRAAPPLREGDGGTPRGLGLRRADGELPDLLEVARGALSLQPEAHRRIHRVRTRKSDLQRRWRPSEQASGATLQASLAKPSYHLTQFIGQVAADHALALFREMHRVDEELVTRPHCASSPALQIDQQDLLAFRHPA
jgi:hypothetical protein